MAPLFVIYIVGYFVCDLFFHVSCFRFLLHFQNSFLSLFCIIFWRYSFRVCFQNTLFIYLTIWCYRYFRFLLPRILGNYINQEKPKPNQTKLDWSNVDLFQSSFGFDISKRLKSADQPIYTLQTEDFIKRVESYQRKLIFNLALNIWNCCCWPDLLV